MICHFGGKVSMKSSVFKKIIASVLAAGMLLSSVSVYAADKNEDNLAVASTKETTTAVGTVETSDNSVETNSDDDLKITYSTDAENGKLSDNTAPTDVTWVGSVSGSSIIPGSENNPYAVSDVAHLLDMSRIINQETSNLKYFKLTANIDLSGITSMDDISASAANGLANTIVSIDPELEESENIFFVLDGAGRYIRNLNISDDSRNSF